jgi:hypothetical protein
MPTERVGDRRQQGLPFIGERQPARKPAKKLHAQSLFQAFDLLADGCLGDAQFQPGAGKAELPCRSLEGPKRV